MDNASWQQRAQIKDDEIEVNATGRFIKGFVWPNISIEFYLDISMVISHILFIAITIAISRKCLLLQLARTAKHAFYCAVAQVLCVSEAMMIRNALMHTTFGLLGCLLGFFGVGTEVLRKQTHFRSKHGRFGLAGCLLLFGSFFTGMWLLLQQLRNEFSISLLFGHRVCGLFCFMATMGTLMFSYNTGFMHHNWQNNHIAVFKCCTLMAMLGAVCYEYRYFAASIAALIPNQILDAISVYERDRHLG
ncbi:uncharacterized protein LOC6565485 [Drosophila grimshawi]|uniref:GH12477 n=1 Tax=Drosophila grimshawi TaxID=7222 RepID=B4JJF5_DROGR|nr:uncharacterized protein LOC6565485 [Drosophila grimshawi]EDV99707.1 GH12477 [Drosophila grimshawi]